MDDKTFKTALWASDWETIIHDEKSCEQGVVVLDDERGVILDLPFGKLLRDCNSLPMPGDNQLPSGSNWLYGFSQDGQWLALRDVVSTGLWESAPGAPHQTLAATQILAGKKRFDPNQGVSKAWIGIRGLRDWFSPTAEGSPLKWKGVLGQGE